jgi:hypothetical protein
MKIPLAYLSELMKNNHREYVEWDTDLHPNLAVIGDTGSGKSYFIRLLLGYISLFVEKAKVYVCDYKKSLLNIKAPRYWCLDDVKQGFEQFEYEFIEKMTGANTNRDFRLLLIDEYINWLDSLDKKEEEDIKKRMASLLRMVREYDMHVILGCHRVMAENFHRGSRDCLNAIYLGSPSIQSLDSFCSSDDVKLMKPRGRGEGYTVFKAQNPGAITVAEVKNSRENLETAILKLVTDKEG